MHQGKHTLFLFYFACHFFLKLKQIHNLTDAHTKRTAIGLLKYIFFVMFWFLGSSRQAILKSWQPWLWNYTLGKVEWFISSWNRDAAKERTHFIHGGISSWKSNALSELDTEMPQSNALSELTVSAADARLEAKYIQMYLLLNFRLKGEGYFPSPPEANLFICCLFFHSWQVIIPFIPGLREILSYKCNNDPLVK